jgi:hypothetical protein
VEGSKEAVEHPIEEAPPAPDTDSEAYILAGYDPVRDEHALRYLRDTQTERDTQIKAI